MATGRMLNKKISLNRLLDELSSDTSRLAYTWAIPHLDRDGRMHGDPVVFKSIVFPRRQDITTKQIKTLITEWQNIDLVVWYEANNELWLYFPTFRNNQSGMRYEREPESGIPSPEDGRIVAGSMPDNIPQKGIERNLKEKNNGGPLEADPPHDDQLIDDFEELKLYNAIKDSFESKHGQFDNYGKEGKAIKALITKCRIRTPDNPEDFAKQVLETFWQLRQGRDKYWRGQPFLPSALNASGIWPRVLEEMREVIPDEFQESIAEEIPF